MGCYGQSSKYDAGIDDGYLKVIGIEFLQIFGCFQRFSIEANGVIAPSQSLERIDILGFSLECPFLVKNSFGRAILEQVGLARVILGDVDVAALEPRLVPPARVVRGDAAPLGLVARGAARRVGRARPDLPRRHPLPAERRRCEEGGRAVQRRPRR